ncbi:MAG: hypothetical protein JSU68_01455 [Phycisphaerales bacterium]|nr:MAG: hypothetical protein JSU68_01455 [Phycisphaerales bacterium]
MAGFLYYIPDDQKRTLTQERLREVGFPHANLAAVPGGGANGGPDGGVGHIVRLKQPPHPAGEQPRLMYMQPSEDGSEQEQVWRECADGKWWLGWEKHRPPTPFDLQRAGTAVGRPVTLLDGHEWIVPVVRNIDGTPAVDTVVGISSSGKITCEKPVPPYEKLWGLVGRLVSRAEENLPGALSDEQAFELLCETLTLNYRVSEWELGHLGIFAMSKLHHVFMAILDLPESLDQEG